MGRFIDAIRAAGRSWEPWFIERAQRSTWEEHAVRLWPILLDPQLPVLLIDSVASYYFQSDQEFWNVEKDFPNIAPPLPEFWVEFRIPEKIRSLQRGVADVTKLIKRGHVGLLVHGVDPADCKGEGIPANVRSILWFELFMDYGRGDMPPVVGPHGSMFLAVDGKGAAVGVPWIQAPVAKGPHDAHMKMLLTWISPVLLAISVIHSDKLPLDKTEIEVRM